MIKCVTVHKLSLNRGSQHSQLELDGDSSLWAPFSMSKGQKHEIVKCEEKGP